MKKNMKAFAAIFVVMAVIPWAAVMFAPGDAGMAICFVLFFGLNPLASLLVGVYAGMDVKKRWYLPMVNAAVFLASAWAVFTPGEPAFRGYAAAYLLVGLLAMAIGNYVCCLVGKYQKELQE